MTLPIYLDPSFTDALTMYEGDTVPYEALVWQRFVALNSIDTSQSLTSEQKESFRLFLQRYQAWDLGVPALTSKIAERSDYQNYYTQAQTIFTQNNLAPTDVEIRDMWRAFLYSNGYTSAPSKSIDFSDAFASYVQGLCKKAIAFDWASTSGYVDPDKVSQIQLWNRFLEINDISSTSTPSDALKQQFNTFLQRYNTWRVSNTVLQSTNQLPSPSSMGASFILNYLNAFYGDLSNTEQTDLWNAFLETEGMASTPSDLIGLQNDFIDYISAMRAKEQRLEGATSLSPKEVQGRLILNNVMSSLGLMLTESQNVVSNYATAIITYGKWQKEYTTMMERVPSLSAIKTTDIPISSDTTLRIPSGDTPTDWSLADYTFGYDKISLSEVTNWAVYNLLDPSLPLGTQITFAPTPEVGSYSFSLQTDASGNKTISISYSNSTVPGDTTGTYVTISGSSNSDSTSAAYNPPVATIDPSTGLSLSASDIEANVETAYKQLFTYLFSVSPDLKTYLTGTSTERLPALQGRYLATEPTTYTDSKGNPAIDSSEIQKRTEQNALLQQYIEGIRSNRDALQTQMTQMQNALSSARDAIDNISEFWSSILEAINTIMKAIFKHAQQK